MLRPIPRHPRNVRWGEHLGTFASLAAAFAVAAIIVVLPPTFAAVAVLAPAAGLLLISNPLLLPVLLIATVPVQDLLPVPAGAPLTATRAALAAGLAITPFVILSRALHLRWSRFMLVIAAYIGIMMTSLLNATVPGEGYAEMYRWVVALIAFWLIIQFIETRRQVIVIALLFAFLAIAQGSVGIIQAVIGWGPESFEIGMGFSRAYGTFGMPNSYAAYMEAVTIPLIPLAVWSISRSWQSFHRYRHMRLHGFISSADSRRQLIASGVLTAFLCTVVVVGIVGIAFSFSRGGWLGTVAALVVVAVLLGRKAIIGGGILTLLVAILLALGVSGTAVAVLEDRFSQLIDQVRIGDVRGVPVTAENFATIERMAHWQTAIAMWNDHPWIGIGAGNFNERFREYAVHPFFLDSQGHAHNYYLHVMAETGLLGLATYVALLIAAAIVSWNAYRSSDALARAIGIGALALTAAVGVHNFFENLHVLNISIQIVAVWALAIVAARWSGNAQSRVDCPRGHRQTIRGETPATTSGNSALRTRDGKSVG